MPGSGWLPILENYDPIIITWVWIAGQTRLINRPVKAAAEGYIARVSVAPFGFGQAIYINHPNGLTTVYGHLTWLLSPLWRSM